VSSETPCYAWHYLGNDGRIATYHSCWNGLQPHSGEKVEAGKVYRVDGKIIPCQNGLHASKRALDGLEYASGCIISRVILSGTVVEERDKAAASERTVLWVADATKTLHEFAVWCAEQALLQEREAGREPDPRCWAALETKRRWLTGQATDEDLHAARAAAREAAWAAAREAMNAELERRLLLLAPVDAPAEVA
jgi:hypothetical protein